MPVSNQYQKNTFGPTRTGITLLTILALVGVLGACGGGGTAVNSDEGRPADPPDGNEPAPTPPSAIVDPSGNVNQAGGGTIGSVTRALTAQQFAHQFSAPTNRSSAPTNTIAYFDDGESDKLNFYLIDADGSNQRKIRTIPIAPTTQASPNTLFDSVIADGLTWRPDGTELAFTSNFEVLSRRAEIYAMTADGSNLRRLTSVPRPIAYPNYPQGTVEMTVQYPDLTSGTAIGYLEGSQQAWGWLGFAQERRTITFQAADFGPGIAQRALLLNFGICHDDPINNIDVIAGDTVVARRILPASLLTIDYPCETRNSPQWLDNDRLVFLDRAHVGANTVTSFSPAFAITETPVENLSPATQTTQIARYTTFDRRGNEFFNIVEGASNEFLRIRVNPTSGNFLVLDQVNSPLIEKEDKIFTGNLSAPSSGSLRRLTVCPEALNCDLVDAQWIPSFEGFAYTTIEDANRSSLRLQTTRDGGVTIDTLIQIPDGVLGNLAVSPDGQRILVERRPARIRTSELWMFDRQSGDFSQFVASGKSPAWR